MSNILWYNGYELLIKAVVKADNCDLYDDKGRRYVDLESGVWCTSVGHNHSGIHKALNEQANEISHSGFTYSHPVVEESASLILNLLGFEAGKCVFLCSGSEAVEFGVRAMQQLSAKPLLLTMADSYFGAYGSASLKKEDEWFSFNWIDCTTCHKQEFCDPECERFKKIPFGEIGGFLFEPGSSSGFVRFPPKSLIEIFSRTIRMHGGLLMINEVTTGTGRTGEWFGYQHYEIKPDIVAIGKGIGNGYPVSVAAFSNKVGQELEKHPIRYAQSHQNDPLGAKVVMEVISIISRENLISRSLALGDYLIKALKEITRKHAIIREVRGRGLMLAIELQDNESFENTIFVQNELFRKGYIIARRPGTNVLRMDPALTIPESYLKNFITDFEFIVGDLNKRSSR